MHVISRKALRDFWEAHPDSEGPLLRWFKIVERSDFPNFQAIRACFPSADMVDNYIVFNIGGNKYRLIVDMRYDLGRIYIRHVLTHEEYTHRIQDGSL